MVTIHCSKCGEKIAEDSKFCTKCGAPAKNEAESEQKETVIERFENDPHLQEHWIRRLIAYGIDSIIVGAATAILLGILVFPLLLTNLASIVNLFNFSLVMGVLYIIYFTAAESLYGATFGKSLLGLKVVTKSDKNPSFERAIMRNVSKIHPVLLLLDLIAGLVTSSDLHQKYCDRIAETTVNSEYIRDV